MDKQQIKHILDNAPEGATHVSTNGVFYKIDGYTPLTWWVRGEEWIDSGVHHITQCLSDLRNQLALIEENEKLKDALNAAIRACYDLDAHSVRESNSDYNKACEILDEVEGLSND